MITPSDEDNFPSKSSCLKQSIKRVVHEFRVLESEFVDLVSQYLGFPYKSLVKTTQYLLPYTILIKSIEINSEIFEVNSSPNKNPVSIRISNNWLDFSALCRSQNIADLIRDGEFKCTPSLDPFRAPDKIFIGKRLIYGILWIKTIFQMIFRFEIRDIGFASDIRRVFGLKSVFNPHVLILNPWEDNKHNHDSSHASIGHRRLDFFKIHERGSHYSHLAWILFFLMPVSSVEGFKSLHQKSNRYLANYRLGSDVNLVALTSHFSSDLLRAIRFGSWATNRAYPFNLNVVQHGGQFGTQEIAITEWMDLYMADTYHVLGDCKYLGVQGGEYTCCIAEKVGLSVRSTRLQRLPERKSLYGKAPLQRLGVLIVLPTAPGRNQHFVTCGLVASNVDVFYARIAQLVKLLVPEWSIKVKVSPKKFGVTFEDTYVPSEFGYLSVDGTVIGQILKSEIAIITYDGTAVLEALRTGAPFVWVIDQDFYPLRQSIITTLKTIENSGVVHFSFQSVARFLQDCDDVDKWWSADKTRESIEFLKSTLGTMLE